MNILAYILKIKKMGLEWLKWLQKTFTKDILKMMIEVVLEYVCLQVELYIKENEKMMSLLDKVFYIVEEMKS